MSDEMFRFETAQFIIRATITPADDLDLSWDEDGETAAKLESGEYVAFDTAVTVTVKATGTVIGADYLGGSIYADPAEFFAEHRACGVANRAYAAAGNPGRCGSYFSGLISEACADARRTLARFPTLRHVRAA